MFAVKVGIVIAAGSGFLGRRLINAFSPDYDVFVLTRRSSRRLGTEPSLALTSCRASPQQLLEKNLEWQFPTIRAAFEDLFSRV